VAGIRRSGPSCSAAAGRWRRLPNGEQRVSSTIN
jgi:hypothetical protein